MVSLEAIVASVCYTRFLVAILCFIIFFYLLRGNEKPMNWPLIGMLPIFFPIFHHVYDSITQILQRNAGTLMFKGPWFANMDFIITSDPANVDHIMSKNFSNYPKGPDTKKIFEAYGDALFTADLEEWTKHKKIAHAFFNNSQMQHLASKVNLEILEKGLIPFLDQASEQGLVVDLQDLLLRCMSDATSLTITGHRHGSLHNTIGFSEEEEERLYMASHDANHGIFMRNVLPETIWKFQRWLGVGAERKLRKAVQALDDFAAEHVTRIKHLCQIQSGGSQVEFNAIKYFLENNDVLESIGHPDKVLKDIVRGLMFTGDPPTSALTWFFLQLLEKPVIQSKIRDELVSKLSSTNKAEKHLFYQPDELKGFVYLHATFCESLRLFPAAPFECRTSINPDILPSGHRVNSATKVLLCSYAMGRMKSLWGEDCLKFRPERWLSEKEGTLKPVPSNKFFSFSSGPRLCPGKELGMIRLKAIAATIMHNYNIQMIKDRPVTPGSSIILHLKHGLKVKVTKRWN